MKPINLLVLFCLLFAGTAQAKCVELCEKKQESKPKVIYKTVTVKEAVAKTDPTKATANAAANATGQATATTGQQSIVINMPQPTKERVRTVKRTIIKRKEVKVNVTNPNRLQLLVGQSKTKLKVEGDDCLCDFSATRKYQPDFGLQYLRDFGPFTGSIMGTTNRSYYLGLGFNF